MSVRTLVKSIQNIMRQDTGVDGDAQRISQLCWMFFLKIIDDQDQELELMRDDYASPIPAAYQWRSWAADPDGAPVAMPFTKQDSAMQARFAEADCLIVRKPHAEPIKVGQRVEILLLRGSLLSL